MSNTKYLWQGYPNNVMWASGIANPPHIQCPRCYRVWTEERSSKFVYVCLCAYVFDIDGNSARDYNNGLFYRL